MASPSLGGQRARGVPWRFFPATTGRKSCGRRRRRIKCRVRHQPPGYVPGAPVGHGPRAFLFRGPGNAPLTVRVSAFIDGFNLYHAVADTGRHELKWIDLRRLVEQFAPTPQYELGDVLYFSAFATWLPAPYARHREYVAALEAVGVTCVMGQFKEKPEKCRTCGARWPRHEEKETDVNAALHLVQGALTDRYDLALLVSGDSDLSPAVRMVRELTPKAVRVLTPVGRRHSMELVQAAGGTRQGRKMQPIHLERAVLPAEVKNAAGVMVATRPTRYARPRNAGAGVG